MGNLDARTSRVPEERRNFSKQLTRDEIDSDTAIAPADASAPMDEQRLIAQSGVGYARNSNEITKINLAKSLDYSRFS